MIEFSYEAPDIFWKKFFSKMNEIDSLPVKDWNDSHLIFYFCKKYYDLYKIAYTFKFNSSPSKSYEMFNMKKLKGMLSSNPEIVKDYIDWAFREKAILKKKRITVMGFLSTLEYVNEYKFKYLAEQKITRSTLLSNNIIELAKKHNLNISTYGDLAWIYLMVEKDIENNSFFIDLKSAQFNIEILKTLT